MTFLIALLRALGDVSPAVTATNSVPWKVKTALIKPLTNAAMYLPSFSTRIPSPHP